MGGLSVAIVHIGEPKVAFIRSGIEHYRKKIQPYASVEMKAVRAEPLRKGSSVLEIQRRERQRLWKAIDPRYKVVVLEQGGRQFGSEAFADLVQEWMVQGRSRLAFLIGGPCGLAPEVRQDAELALSLSSMTLSHELSLLVLMEQLYRALAILNKLPYPK